MKPLTTLIILAVAFVFATAAFAQSTVTIVPDDAEALTLLQRMLQAESDLNLTGDQTTVLHRPEQTFSSTQTIERKGDHAFKLQFHTPDALNGEVYVDNGRVAWHSIPSSKTLQVGPSNLARFKRASDEVMQKLQSHQLTVHLVGHDIVAGQIAQVIQVTASGSWNERKYWIDPVTGAQLKIQTFGAVGQLVAETYYTRINYDNQVSWRDFGPPPVDPTFQVVPIVPRGSTTSQSIPTSDQCGFTVTTPAFLPTGFNYQSSFITPIGGAKLVGLNYSNGLVNLSIFEQPYTPPAGSKSSGDKYRSVRQGVLIARKNGYRYILVAALPESVLEQIAQSVK